MTQERHVAAAESLLEVGRPQLALEQAARALAADPTDVDALCVMARCEREFERYPAMLAAATAAAHAAPERVEAHILCSQALLQLGRKRESVAAAAEAVRLSPGSASAQVTYALALFSSRRRRRAWAALGEATRLSPEWPTVYYIAGAMHRAAGRNRRAKKAFERALELRPDHAGALEGLGRVALRGGRLGLAVRHFGSAAASPHADGAVPGFDLALRALTGQGLFVSWLVALALAFGGHSPVAWIIALAPPAAYGVRLRSFVAPLSGAIRAAVRARLGTDIRLRARVLLAVVTLGVAVVSGWSRLAGLTPEPLSAQGPFLAATVGWIVFTAMVVFLVDIVFRGGGTPRRSSKVDR